MIGQVEILNKVKADKKLPRFTIITGRRGQGKKTLAKEIAKIVGIQLVEVGIKVDDIRYMIDISYKQAEPIIYLISDADEMSLGAKNSLLKVIEEPPQNAYFIMTLKQIENTLATIRSRCQEIRMQEYTYDEKMEMIKEINSNTSEDEIIILNKLDNYWQIQKVVDYGTIQFYEYVDKVYDNICKVPSANSFKFSDKLDIKNDGNGYDVELFFTSYNTICMGELWDAAFSGNWHDTVVDTANSFIKVTQRYLDALNIKGVNKQMLLDMWCLEIRKVWKDAIK